MAALTLPALASWTPGLPPTPPAFSGRPRPPVARALPLGLGVRGWPGKGGAEENGVPGTDSRAAVGREPKLSETPL